MAITGGHCPDALAIREAFGSYNDTVLAAVGPPSHTQCTTEIASCFAGPRCFRHRGVRREVCGPGIDGPRQSFLQRLRYEGERR